MAPEQAEEVLETWGESWLYGPGLGEAALNVGASLLFPPYALYLLGNSALALSGFEPLYLSDALPELDREAWRSFHDEVSSGPGRVAAAVAGKEYVTRERARANLKQVLDKSAAARQLPSVSTSGSVPQAEKSAQQHSVRGQTLRGRDGSRSQGGEGHDKLRVRHGNDRIDYTARN